MFYRSRVARCDTVRLSHSLLRVSDVDGCGTIWPRPACEALPEHDDSGVLGMTSSVASRATIDRIERRIDSRPDEPICFSAVRPEAARFLLNKSAEPPTRPSGIA
eukprot:scaffold60551_cov30-Tisochrysis_lutea.AAC.2